MNAASNEKISLIKLNTSSRWRKDILLQNYSSCFSLPNEFTFIAIRPTPRKITALHSGNSSYRFWQIPGWRFWPELLFFHFSRLLVVFAKENRLRRINRKSVTQLGLPALDSNLRSTGLIRFFLSKYNNQTTQLH